MDTNDRRAISSPRRKLRPLYIIVLAALIAGVIVWALCLRDPWSLRFESSAWKATPATFERNSLRLRMVDDLIRSHPLIGASRAEVESLIGPPDDTPYFRGYDMVYALGMERAYFAIDSEWLVFRLDEADRVSEFRLVTD